MLIFTLPSWYKTEKHPQNSIFIYEQMQAIKQRNHKVVVLSVQSVPVQTLQKPDRSIKRVNDNGIITYYTEILSVYPSKFRYLYIDCFFKALKRLIDTAKLEIGNPDLYYAHFSFPAGYCASRLNDGVPLVVEEHYSGLMENPDRKLIECVKQTVKKSEKFICVSHGLQTVVKNIAGENEKKIVVVGNMIDSRFKYYPMVKQDCFSFFSLGSLIPRKGFDLLIKAFYDEFKDQNNVVLNIGGSGSEYEHLSSLIKALGMHNRIKLLGQLDRNQTLQELKKCNCFALASKAETFGIVYREAMAVGRPIISTKHGGFGTNWSDKYGVLIDVDDLRQLKDAMRSVYENFSSYEPEVISAMCLKECSADSVSNQLVDIFESVINIRRPKVSVIVPTYKGYDTVIRAVESVLDQSYGNLEVIVIDDNGSGTAEQIQTENELKKNIHDSRLIYLKHEKNINGSAARNTGIRASSGEYIAFLDDDDIWFKDKLKRQIEVFETLDDSYGLVYCGGYNVNLQGCGAPKISKFLQGDILYDFLLGKIDFNSSMIMIRRSVLDDVNGFDESYRRLQDWEFCTRIFYKYKAYGMQEYLIAKYRAERNNPQNPEKLLEYYEHYMDKSKEILDSLGEERASKVKARYYRRIALEYLKHKNIKNAIPYLRKNENFFTGMWMLGKYVLVHGYYRIRYRKKKCV